MNTIYNRDVTPDPNPHHWIEAVRHSHDRLVSLVQPLHAEGLRLPSYHSWTIAEVLSHLGGQAELFMEWVTAALDRSEAPDHEAMVQIWDAWNARGPEEQAADSIEYNERLVARLEHLTDDELERMHLNLFGMELDGVALVRLRVSEHSLHTWDIAVALDPTAQVTPDAVALLIDTLGSLVQWVGKPQEETFRLHVVTTDPERNFTLQVTDRVELTEGTGGSADGELRIPAEAFLRLVYGRLDPSHTTEVQLTGNVTLDGVRSVFPGL